MKPRLRGLGPFLAVFLFQAFLIVCCARHPWFNDSLAYLRHSLALALIFFYLRITTQLNWKSNSLHS